jgi:hypothetical protein
MELVLAVVQVVVLDVLLVQVVVLEAVLLVPIGARIDVEMTVLTIVMVVVVYVMDINILSTKIKCLYY